MSAYKLNRICETLAKTSLLFVTVLNGASSLATQTLPANPYSAPPTENPPLRAGTDLHIALVVDASGSIRGPIGTPGTSQYEVSQGILAFAKNLEGSSAQVAIIEFGDLAYTPIPYTETTATNYAQIFAPYATCDGSYPLPSGTTCYASNPSDPPLGLGQATNWDAGLRQVALLSPRPDLIIFMTDGLPNLVCADPYPNCTSTNPVPFPKPINATNAAILDANILKSAGSHIFTIGVGQINDTTTSGTVPVANINNLFQLTNGMTLYENDGKGAVKWTTSTPIGEADYVTVTDLADYTLIVAGLARLPGALNNSWGLTINTFVDEDGSGNYVAARGQAWQFSASSNVVNEPGFQWNTPASGVGLTSETTGQILFEWTLSNSADVSDITVTQTLLSGYVLDRVTCLDATGTQTPIAVSKTTFTVTGLAAGGFASCNVYNRNTVAINAGGCDQTHAPLGNGSELLIGLFLLWSLRWLIRRDNQSRQ